MNNAAWTEGWKRLKACLRDRDLSPEQEIERGRVYRQRLQHLDDAAWLHAVDSAISTMEWFPSIGLILSFTAPPQASRAGEVYAEIAEAYTNPIAWEQSRWSPNADAVWERWGLAARRAFLACGGARAFEWCEPENEPFRLKAFREAFIEAAKSEPLALPAPEATKALR